jgi:NAD+ synthase (glutamine-hydrolysing)
VKWEPEENRWWVIVVSMKLALAQIDVVANKPEKNVEKMLEMVAMAKRASVDLVVFPEMCVGGYLLGDRWRDVNYCRDLMEYNEPLRMASSGIAIAYGNVYLEEPGAGRRGATGGRGGGEATGSAVGGRRASKKGEVPGDARDEWATTGNPHPNKDGGLRRYNAVYVFQECEPAPRLSEALLPRGVQPKTILPEYRIFDDERYFFSTQDVAKDFGVPLESLLQPILVSIGGRPTPIGFELCEDMWSGDYRRNGMALNPTKILIDNGAEFVMNLSASPWTFGKNQTRDRRVRFLKTQSGRSFVPFFYVNCVGAQNNGKDVALFDGASTVYNADGLPVMLGASTYLEEMLIVGAGDLLGRPVRRVDPGKTEQQFLGILRGIRHMSDILGRTPTYVVGLSGGIDSAVVTSLLTVAVGNANVVGVNMPTRYNKQATRDSARHVAERLGIRYLVIPIEELAEANRKLLPAGGVGARLGPTLEQNIQAKVRNQVLSNLAELYGGLYTCNGNKWEIATGYSTLDGDARGALSPIGDLTKIEVFQMAEYLNKHFERELIPRGLIDLELPPGAELARDQVNPLKLGYHCALIEAFMDFQLKSVEDVMQWYLDGTLAARLGVTREMMHRYAIDDPAEFIRDLEWFQNQLQRSVFKRVQGPPIILLSKTAYGYDRRESILPAGDTILHNRLKGRVLSMRRYTPRPTTTRRRTRGGGGGGGGGEDNSRRRR